jgi:hydroxypyruvate reductase
LFEAAVAGAQPRAATRKAVAALDIPPAAAIWVIALGKAAHAMAAGAAEGLADRQRELAGGVVVAPAVTPNLSIPRAIEPALAQLRVVAGDHPIPGPQSMAAANAIGETAASVREGDHVIVLVSGGGTSLAAAPAPDVTRFSQNDLAELYAALMTSGADISAMNAVRKRFARWAGGRLAVALAPAWVHCLIVSDVVGDDVASISSGPCVGDPVTARELVTRLERSGIWARIPEAARHHLSAAVNGDAPETPKPHDAAFAHVAIQVIVSNANAISAAAAAARTAGIDEVTVAELPLSGEASIAGVRLASELMARQKRARGPDARKSKCVIWGGETTVTFAGAGAGAPPAEALGGRNQELALAAARSLDDDGEQMGRIAILAAGTDGRDGPTDAAGAIVDGTTWRAVEAAGRDPAADLASHAAHRALAAAGALLKTGHTGTNVMDIVIGLIL